MGLFKERKFGAKKGWAHRALSKGDYKKDKKEDKEEGENGESAVVKKAERTMKRMAIFFVIGFIILISLMAALVYALSGGLIKI